MKDEYKLNKKEKENLNNRGYSFIEENPSSIIIDSLIVISHGNKELHDSGYPFIKIFGVVEKNKMIFLGWHDHWISYVPTNTDSLGKNIFHVMPWISGKKKWKVTENFMSFSTFQIGDYDSDSKDFVILS